MMTQEKTRIHEDLELRVWNFLTLGSFLIAVFVLLTSGVPLEQLGILGVSVTKKLATRWMRLSVFVHFAILACVYFFRKPFFDRLGLVKGVQKLIRINRTVLGLVLFSLYSAVMITVGFLRHASLETRSYDLGIFAQAVWNTLQGDFLYSSIKGGINLMGDHVSPILVLISPLYAVWPHPMNLIILQALAAAACLFPLAYLADQKLENRWLVLVFMLAYVFYLPTRNTLHEDFHPEVLAEPFLILAFIFLERKKILPFILTLLVAVTAKENMLGIAFMFGGYAFLFKKMRMFGSILMVLSAALFLFCIMWVTPHFNNGAYFYRGVYSHILTNPAAGIFQAAANPEAWEYLLKIFLPFLFLPFFHFPTLTLTFPVLFQNMLSKNPLMRSFGYHYTTGLTPFVFIAAIYGFKSVTDRFVWLRQRQALLGTVFLMVALLRSGPSEYFFGFQSYSHGSPHRVEIRNKLHEIPAEASVLTHNNFIPQLVHRKEVYQFSYDASESKAAMADQLKPDYVIFDREFWEQGAPPPDQELLRLRAQGYAVEDEKDGFYILKR